VPRLVYVDRQGIERSIPVGADFPRVTVGRNPDCTIQVTKPSVSRLHSEFTFHNGVIEVADLGSSNGTFINGREIRRQTLRDRDEVKCGDFILRVFMEDDNAAPMPPPLPASQPPAYAPPPQAAGYQQQPTQLPGGPQQYDYGRQAPPPQRPASGGYADPYTAPPNPYGAPSAQRAAYPAAQPTAYPAEPDPYRSGSYGAATQTGYGSQSSRAAGNAGEPDAQRLMRDNQALREKIADQDAIINVLRDDSGGPGLQAQLDKLRADNAELRSERDKLRTEIADYIRTTGDGDGRYNELRRDVEQKQLMIESYQDRYERLKEQAEEQLGQIEEYRAELKEKKQTIDDLEYRHREVEQAQQKGSSHVAELIEENADLKVRINQLERQHEEVLRNSNLTEFELKKVRQESENLRLMIDAEGSENVGLTDEITHLRQVIDVKENDIITKEREIEDLLAELEGYRNSAGDDDTARKRLLDELSFLKGTVQDLRDNNDALHHALEDAEKAASAAPARGGASNALVEQLQADLDALRRDNEQLHRELEANGEGASGGSNAQAQINQLKRQNRDFRHQVEDLEDQLARLRASGGAEPAAGADPAEVRELRNELEDLRRENDDLRLALDEAERAARRSTSGSSSAAGADPAELDRLKRDKRRLEDELEDLRHQLDRAVAASSARPSGDGGGSDALRAQARPLVQNLNDSVSLLRNNMQLMSDYIADIKRIYEAVSRADLQGLQTLDRVRLEKVIREVEPDVTFEELGQLMGDAVNDAEEMKDQLLKFKDTIRS